MTDDDDAPDEVEQKYFIGCCDDNDDGHRGGKDGCHDVKESPAAGATSDSTEVDTDTLVDSDDFKAEDRTGGQPGHLPQRSETKSGRSRPD